MFLKISNSHRKTPVLESLFNKVVGLQPCIFIKKRLQYSCFPVNIKTFWRILFFTEHLWPLSAGCFWRFTSLSLSIFHRKWLVLCYKLLKNKQRYNLQSSMSWHSHFTIFTHKFFHRQVFSPTSFFCHNSK